jgi:hypothetical protein
VEAERVVAQLASRGVEQDHDPIQVEQTPGTLGRRSCDFAQVR